MGNLTAAHSKNVTVRFIERYPAHEPRKNDPHYKYFNAAKRRMKKAGLLKCNVQSKFHYGLIELHHDKVEFAHINDIDETKFNELYGLHLDDEQFQIYVESEGNLEPLCTEHHRGTTGVHSLPEPEWNTLRASKDDREILMAQLNNQIPVVRNKQ